MQRKLGSSGFRMSALGLGLADFAAGSGWLARRLFAPLSQRDKTAIVEAALASGVDWFDTAEMYGFGVSERSLATALRQLAVSPGQISIATKWFPLLRTAADVPRSLAARREALGEYPITLFMVHHPYGFSSVSAEMKAMARLAADGLIGGVGVSNFSAKAMREAHRTLAGLGLPLLANEIRFNLLCRDIEFNGVLETARELGVSLIAYGPLAKGFLSGRFHRDPALLATQGLRRRLMMPQDLARTAALVRTLEEIAARRGVSAAQVALAWVLQRHGEVMFAVAAATSPSQARANAQAMSLELTSGETEALEVESLAFRR